jgi:hypothetical protein
MKKIIIAVFLIALLSGCTAGRPTPAQLATEDFGPYPDNYEEITKNYISKDFYDPYSAVFVMNKPTKALTIGQRSRFAWVVCGTVNAKNRFGGYVGAKPFYVKIYNGAAEDSGWDHIADIVCSSLQK